MYLQKWASNLSVILLTTVLHLNLSSCSGCSDTDVTNQDELNESGDASSPEDDPEDNNPGDDDDEQVTLSPQGTELSPIYPAEGWDVTDIALSFRWYSHIVYDSETDTASSAKKYQLQVDNNEDFSSPEIDAYQTRPVESYEDDRQTYVQWNQIYYMPPQLLSPDTYYWRVRVADEDTLSWTTAVEFSVNSDHTYAAPIREVSPTSPLFSFDMFCHSNTEKILSKIPEIHARFPEAVQPYVAFAVQNEPIGINPSLDDGYNGTFADLLLPYADTNTPILIKTGGPDKDFQQFADLTELEHIFKTQPHVIGLLQGETFWDFIDSEVDIKFYEQHVTWYKRSFQLAAKYGRIVVFGNGNDESFVWDKFLADENSDRPWMNQDDIRALKDHLILAPKNNIPFGYYHAESAVMGAWLAGLSTHWGVWSEGWAWGSIGYSELFGPQLAGSADDPDFSSMPYNIWIQMKLAGLSQGATFYHFGGESSVVEWGTYNPETGYFEISDDEVLTQSTAFWDMEGNEHPAFMRYIAPFLEAVVTQQLIPTKAEVLDKVQLAVAAPSLSTDKGSALDYGIYAPLFRHTIGLDGYITQEQAEGADEDLDYYEMTPNTCRRELIHDKGRYYMTPILPYPIESLSDGTPVLQISELDTPAKVQSQFDAVYPGEPNTTAWVVQIGNKLFVNNSLENTNEDQSFSVEIPGVAALSGVIQPHTYLLGTVSSEAIWFMANAGGKGSYTDDRTTRLSLTLDDEPSTAVVGGEAAFTWQDGTLEIELNHQAGAVQIQINLASP